MDIKEIDALKNKLFPSEDSLKKFLIRITKELLVSKVKNETLNPILLTHKEFIDTSLSKLIKKLKNKIFSLAKSKNMNVGDKILEIKLEYLAGYILKYDLVHKKYIHKTIAKHILNIIRKEHLTLNKFVSTLNRDIYEGKFGKFRYPPLYPYDKNRYNNPIPELKQLLNKIDAVSKSLNEKELKLIKLKNKLENSKLQVTQIKTSATDMKDIIVSLKKKYQDEELKNRLMMIKNQHSRFNVLLIDLKEKIINFSKESNSLSKNIEASKQKYKEILNKEEEILDILAKNLSQMKVKVHLFLDIINT